MTARQYISEALETFTDKQLAEVAEYVTFLKLRARSQPPPSYDEAQVASLYEEFAAEDRTLAEEGMRDFARGLAAEDSR
jgi:hypothetical protein